MIVPSPGLEGAVELVEPLRDASPSWCLIVPCCSALEIYIYIYIYIYIHTYVCIFLSLSLSIYIYIYIHTMCNMYTMYTMYAMYVHICICVHT